MQSRVGFVQFFSIHRWPLCLFFSAIGFRVFNIGSEALWYDEAFSAFVVQLPLKTMLAALAGDTHPPLWYMLEFGSVHLFGGSILALRFSSALFGSAAVLTLYYLISRLIGSNAARWGSVLMVISPAHIYYAQEARMYSLLTLLTLLAAHAIISRHWLRLSLLLALIPFTQSLGALYSVLLFIWAMISSRGSVWRHAVVPALAYLPQGIITFIQARQFQTGYWIADPGNLGGLFYPLYYTTFYLRMPAVLQLHGILFALLASAVSLIVLRREVFRLLPLIMLAFLPPVILFLISIFIKPIMVDRYVLPSGAALLGLWGTAASQLPKPFQKPVAAVAIPMLLIALVSYYIDPLGQRAKSFPATDIIRDNWQAGDAIYHNEITSLVEYEPYLKDLPSYTLPETGTLAGSLSDATKMAMGIKAREREVYKLTSHYRRLWFIGEISVMSSRTELWNQAVVLDHYPVIQRWRIIINRLRSVTLYLLELP